MVRKALRRAHREDLIGNGPDCIVREDFRAKNIADKNGTKVVYSEKKPLGKHKNPKLSGKSKKPKRVK
jgi:hypothetical protein